LAFGAIKCVHRIALQGSEKDAVIKQLYDKKDALCFTKDLISKYCCADKDFYNFCVEQSQKRSSPWILVLKKRQQPYFTIQSLNKSSNLNLVDHTIGYYLFKQYQSAATTPLEKKAYLDKGCEMGHFWALQERCTINSKLVCEAGNELTKTFALGELLNDIAVLGNLYGTLGFAVGALELFQLGTYFTLETKSINPDNYERMSSAYYEQAAKNIFKALYLYKRSDESSIDKALIDIITKGEGLSLLTKNINQGKIGSLEDLIKIILKPIKGNEKIIQDRAELELKGLSIDVFCSPKTN
jgi:hypothetical protein